MLLLLWCVCVLPLSYDRLAQVPALDRPAHAANPVPWEQVVRGHRKAQLVQCITDRALYDQVMQAQVLRGPIVANADEIDLPGGIHTQPEASPEPWTQVAFRASRLNAIDQPGVSNDQTGIRFKDWTSGQNIHVIRVMYS